MRHLLDTRTLERTTALRILDIAEDMSDTQSREVKKLPTLRGKTVVNLFFEDSTRTRISFEAAAKRLMENKFDMNDLLAQFQQVKKMGGASALLAMMPGGGQIDADSLDEKALPRIEAIIYSMTPAERAKPDIINPKRKRRIAAGSGTTVEDVNKLLRQFEMMQKMMKKVKRNPKGFMRSLGSLGGRGGGFRGFGR